MTLLASDADANPGSDADANPTLLSDVLGQLSTWFYIVPVVLLCYGIGLCNFVVLNYFSAVDSDAVMLGTVAFRAWYEVCVCTIKTPIHGIEYLRRKPLVLLVEGVAWTAFVIAFWVFGVGGVHSLWIMYLALWLSTAATTMFFENIRAKKAACISTIDITVIAVGFAIGAGYIAAAVTITNPVLEVVATGVLYPFLKVSLKLLALGMMAKQAGSATLDGITRSVEIALSLPCFVAVLQVDSDASFAASAALAFACELACVGFTMARNSRVGFKAEARAKDASLHSINAARGHKVGSYRMKSSTALMDTLVAQRLCLGVKLSNEAYAEKMLVMVAAPLAMLFSPKLTAQAVAVRTTVLFATEVAVDVAKTRICRRFDVVICNVRPGVLGWVSCVASYVATAWTLSVGVALLTLWR